MDLSAEASEHTAISHGMRSEYYLLIEVFIIEQIKQEFYEMNQNRWSYIYGVMCLDLDLCVHEFLGYFLHMRATLIHEKHQYLKSPVINFHVGHL